MTEIAHGTINGQITTVVSFEFVSVEAAHGLE